MRAEPAPLQLGPATRLLWRGVGAFHLELGTAAVVVEGLPAATMAGLVSGGPRSAAPVSTPTWPGGERLRAGHFLWSASDESRDPRLRPPAPRLAGELTALTARHGEAAVRVLAGRHRSTVVVSGSPRVAVQVAALFAAAGVGRVSCAVSGSVRLQHAAPGALAPADEGRDLALAADEAVRRAAPEVDTTPLPGGRRPDLTVLALDAPLDEDRRDALHAAGAAHLSLELGLDHAVVGPLVLPGLTSCLRCADLHRRDRDPAWPALAAQLCIPRRYGTAGDGTLASVLAGVAVLQALAFLDGEDPAVVEGSLELHLPDWRLRRRTRPVHPACGCLPNRRPSPSAGTPD